MNSPIIDATTDILASLYARNFGGKVSGRYRISRKIVGGLLGRRRIYADDIQNLTRAMLEKGFVLIDMDSFFVVLGAGSFANYRRANQDCIPVSTDAREGET